MQYYLSLDLNSLTSFIVSFPYNFKRGKLKAHRILFLSSFEPSFISNMLSFCSYYAPFLWVNHALIKLRMIINKNIRGSIFNIFLYKEFKPFWMMIIKKQNNLKQLKCMYQHWKGKESNIGIFKWIWVIIKITCVIKNRIKKIENTFFQNLNLLFFLYSNFD